MPTPTLVVGAPCWIDLYSSDPAAASAFYARLFGWTAQPPAEDLGGYFTFTHEGRQVAGCMHNDGTAGVPDGWTIHLMTDDVEATAAAAAAHGGRVDVPPMTVAEHGRMALLVDPGQAAVGVWQPGTHVGFEVTGEPGTPAWFELQTRDYEASVAFYRTVFRWDAHVVADEPDFRYTTLGEGEQQRAGIMDASAFLGEGERAAWSVYLAVDDADATLARVVDLGGRVVRPATDTPYGRLAQAADPTGALFKLVAG